MCGISSPSTRGSRTGRVNARGEQMKAFPEQVEGPMGPWYQKINASIAKAKLAKTPAEIREILGEPSEAVDIPDDNRRRHANAPIDARYPERILVYRDPYRTHIEYRFEVSNGRVIGFTKVRRTA